MKTFIYGLMLTAGLGLAGCAKSFQAEVKDVHDAERHASDKVREKERELNDTKIEEGKKIQKEQRDVEDAASREAARDANRVDTAPAPAVVP